MEKRVYASLSETGYVFVQISEDEILATTEQFHRWGDVLRQPGVETEVHRWMDSVPGRYHRIVHGHSLDQVVEVYEKYGIEGVWAWTKELGYDAGSKQGLPAVLYPEKVRVALEMGQADFVDWCFLNMTDVVVGITAAWSTWQLRNQPSMIRILDGVVKGVAGFATHNPLLLFTAVAGIGSTIFNELTTMQVIEHSGVFPVFTPDNDIPLFRPDNYIGPSF
ncbi:hypothetical protein KQI52_08270 [bacterium]|nr:hypothetical protein [bacterium]